MKRIVAFALFVFVAAIGWGAEGAGDRPDLETLLGTGRYEEVIAKLENEETM